MCGITGFARTDSTHDVQRIIELMGDRIKHRGPDDVGYHIDDTVALVHRRLSIIDLESGKHLKVMPADVMDKYQEQMHRQAAELKRHTIQYRIDYQPVDVGLGMDQVLVPFLLKRSRHH